MSSSAELEQLGVREGRLRGSPPADDHHLVHAAARQHLQRMVGGVRGRELLRREHQHARHVQRHVAVSDYHRALGTGATDRGREVELEVGVVGVAVVPADELRRRMRAGKLFAGYAERAVRRRAGGVYDRVVVRQQVLARDVLAEVDVAVVAKARVRGRLLVDAAD